MVTNVLYTRVLFVRIPAISHDGIHSTTVAAFLRIHIPLDIDIFFTRVGNGEWGGYLLLAVTGERGWYNQETHRWLQTVWVGSLTDKGIIWQIRPIWFISTYDNTYFRLFYLHDEYILTKCSIFCLTYMPLNDKIWKMFCLKKQSEQQLVKHCGL